MYYIIQLKIVMDTIVAHTFFQGSRYGAFSSRLDRAPGLKVYSSYKRAESARLKIYFENASPSDIIIKELAEDTQIG